MITCVVADSCKNSRNRLVSYITKNANWHVAGETDSLEELRTLLLKNAPVVCFLDTNLADGSAIELAKEISQLQKIHWVFTSEQKEHAVDAFDIGAIDFLFKPYENQRLITTMIKVEKLHSMNNQKIAVKSIGSVSLVNTQDIVWIKGAANYVELYCGDKKILHRETLSGIERSLHPDKFIRVHRSSIVNLDQINYIGSELGRYSLIYMKNGDEVRISNAYKDKLFQSLGVN